jgi:hypothetical protein
MANNASDLDVGSDEEGKMPDDFEDGLASAVESLPLLNYNTNVMTNFNGSRQPDYLPTQQMNPNPPLLPQRAASINDSPMRIFHPRNIPAEAPGKAFGNSITILM